MSIKAFTLKRLDHLYFHHKGTWPNENLRECAWDLIDKADKEGLHMFSEWELDMASSLVNMMISQPGYKPDHMDEY